MFNVDLSVRDFDGQAVVALRGELTLADTAGVASHLIAAVAIWRASATAACRCCCACGNGLGRAAVTCLSPLLGSRCARFWKPLA